MTNSDIQNKFRAFLLQTKRYSEERTDSTIQFAESDLVEFISQHFDPEFSSIYSRTDYEYYAAIRGIVLGEENVEAYQDNIAIEELYTQTLKLYIDFLQSKTFRGKEKVHLTDIEKEAKKKDKITQAPAVDILLPGDAEEELTEGRVRQVNITKHERNRALRQACLKHYGYKCQVCKIKFDEVYGEIGKYFIEVHHLEPISNTDEEHALDPLTGLVPLCSNCHSMIHRGGKDGQPMPLEELKQIYNMHKNHDINE